METGKTYIEAYIACNEGKAVARKNWIEKGAFLFKERFDNQFNMYHAPTRPFEYRYGVPTKIKERILRTALNKYDSLDKLPNVQYGSYLCKFKSNGTVLNGWVPTKAEMLATDWCILD
jgi:hypothetical protein